MVIWIPHGCMTLNEVSEKALTESVPLAHELFGVSSFVFMSLPLGLEVAERNEYSNP